MDTLGVTVYTDKISEVSYEGYVSYTMLIKKNGVITNAFYNLTLEQKNNISSMFITKYEPTDYWLENKSEPFQGIITTRRGGNTELAQVDEGTGGAGGNGFDPFIDNCDGEVKETTVVTPYACGQGHMPGEICNGSPTPPHSPGYNYETVYECIEDNSIDYNDGNVSGTGTGGADNNDEENNEDSPSGAGTIIPEECLTSYQVSSALSGLGVSLSGEQLSCITTRENCSSGSTLIQYLEANPTETAFFNEAINAICNGGKVDFENELILDVTFVTDQRLKCVYDKLKESNSSLFKATIGNFISNPKLKMTIKKGNCIMTDDACCDDNSIATTGVVNLIIEDTGGSVLEIASMILHEAIHAEISRYVLLQAPNEDVNDRPRILQLFKYYKALYNEGDIEHIYMTEYYINPIASALRKLDNFSYPIDYYKSYAWDGLRAWDVNNLLSMEEDSNYSSYKAIVEANTSLSCD